MKDRNQKDFTKSSLQRYLEKTNKTDKVNFSFTQKQWKDEIKRIDSNLRQSALEFDAIQIKTEMKLSKMFIR